MMARLNKFLSITHVLTDFLFRNRKKKEIKTISQRVFLASISILLLLQPSVYEKICYFRFRFSSIHLRGEMGNGRNPCSLKFSLGRGVRFRFILFLVLLLFSFCITKTNLFNTRLKQFYFSKWIIVMLRKFRKDKSICEKFIS